MQSLLDLNSTKHTRTRLASNCLFCIDNCGYNWLELPEVYNSNSSSFRIYMWYFALLRSWSNQRFCWEWTWVEPSRVAGVLKRLSYTRAGKQSFGWQAIVEHHTQIHGKNLQVFASPSSSSLNTMNNFARTTGSAAVWWTKHIKTRLFAIRNTPSSVKTPTPQHNSYMLERVFSIT